MPAAAAARSSDHRSRRPFRAERIHQSHEDAAPRLDFEAILPSPDILREATESSSVSTGLTVLGVTLPRKNLFDPKPETFEDMLGHHWVRQAGITTPEQLKAELLARDPGCIAARRGGPCSNARHRLLLLERVEERKLGREG